MNRFNGSIIGPTNRPVRVNSSGVWGMNNVYLSRRDLIWPSSELITGLAHRSSDGTSYLYATNAYNTGPLTVCFWYREELNSTGRGIFTFGNDPLEGSPTMLLQSGGGKISLFVGGYSPGYVTSIGQWHHVAIIWDGTASWSVLVDGVLAITRSGGYSGNDNYAYLLTGYNGKPIGDIADVRIYNSNVSNYISDIMLGYSLETELHWWVRNTNDLTDYGSAGNDLTNVGTTYETDGPLS